MIEWFRESASTYSTWIDNQILLITVLVGFWFLFSEAVFFWLIYKYRAGKRPKAEYITGKEKGPKRFVTVSHALVILCDVFIIVGAIWVWVGVKQTLPAADAEIRVTGFFIGVPVMRQVLMAMCGQRHHQYPGGDVTQRLVHPAQRLPAATDRTVYGLVQHRVGEVGQYRDQWEREYQRQHTQ